VISCKLIVEFACPILSTEKNHQIDIWQAAGSITPCRYETKNSCHCTLHHFLD